MTTRSNESKMNKSVVNRIITKATHYVSSIRAARAIMLNSGIVLFS